MIKIDELKKQATGPVVLTEDSIDAKKQPCHAGTQIAPQVDGWPEHRVLNHLLQKKAKVGSGIKAPESHEHDKSEKDKSEKHKAGKEKNGR
jgi:hypothetical protein